MVAAIESAVRQYAKDTTVLLAACRQLVEYYGADDELASFDASSARPLFLLEAFVSVASGTFGNVVDASPPFAKLVCGEEVASMITPLIRIIVEWEPPFTYDARQTLPADECRCLLTHYGQFLGETGRLLCRPIWSAYPRLAPEGWPG